MGFKNEVALEAQELQLRLNAFVNEVLFLAYRRLVERSPVDTGQYRGSMRIGINAADTSSEPREDAGRALGAQKGKGTPILAAERAYAEEIIASVEFGDVVHFSNNVRHAKFIEAGHSGLAPTGVFRPVRQEVNARVRRLYLAALNSSRGAGGRFAKRG